MYTDDYFVFGNAEYVRQACANFTADAESRLGDNAVKAEKTLCGSDIDIIGYANDTTPAHTIGLSLSLYMKMVCAVYVMVSMDVQPGIVSLSIPFRAWLREPFVVRTWSR